MLFHKKTQHGERRGFFRLPVVRAVIFVHENSESLQIVLLLFVERMSSHRVHDRAGIFELNAVMYYAGRKNGYKFAISARYAMREWVRLVRKFHSSFFQAPLSYSLC